MDDLCENPKKKMKRYKDIDDFRVVLPNCFKGSASEKDILNLKASVSKKKVYQFILLGFIKYKENGTTGNMKLQYFQEEDISIHHVPSKDEKKAIEGLINYSATRGNKIAPFLKRDDIVISMGDIINVSVILNKVWDQHLQFGQLIEMSDIKFSISFGIKPLKDDAWRKEGDPYIQFYGDANIMNGMSIFKIKDELFKANLTKPLINTLHLEENKDKKLDYPPESKIDDIYDIFHHCKNVNHDPLDGSWATTFNYVSVGGKGDEGSDNKVDSKNEEKVVNSLPAIVKSDFVTPYNFNLISNEHFMKQLKYFDGGEGYWVYVNNTAPAYENNMEEIDKIKPRALPLLIFNVPPQDIHAVGLSGTLKSLYSYELKNKATGPCLKDNGGDNVSGLIYAGGDKYGVVNARTIYDINSIFSISDEKTWTQFGQHLFRCTVGIAFITVKDSSMNLLDVDEYGYNLTIGMQLALDAKETFDHAGLRVSCNAFVENFVSGEDGYVSSIHHGENLFSKGYKAGDENNPWFLNLSEYSGKVDGFRPSDFEYYVIPNNNIVKDPSAKGNKPKYIVPIEQLINTALVLPKLNFKEKNSDKYTDDQRFAMIESWSSEVSTIPMVVRRNAFSS